MLTHILRPAATLTATITLLRSQPITNTRYIVSLRPYHPLDTLWLSYIPTQSFSIYRYHKPPSKIETATFCKHAAPAGIHLAPHNARPLTYTIPPLHQHLLPGTIHIIQWTPNTQPIP